MIYFILKKGCLPSKSESHAAFSFLEPNASIAVILSCKNKVLPSDTTMGIYYFN